jgi:hypothetical protein
VIHRVFVDANVLASRTLRDWLFLLRNETAGMFQLHSTFDVLVEAVRAWRRAHPTAPGGRTRELFDLLDRNLDEVLGDYVVDVTFEGDRGDLHVHAAAADTGAHILVTNNVRDFGDPDALPYELCTPDAFFCLIDDGAAAYVREVTRTQVAYWASRRDKQKAIGLDQALVDAGCPEFAVRVQKHLRTLSGVR